MSRVGNKPIPLPKGVKIVIGNPMLVEGPKGKLEVYNRKGKELRAVFYGGHGWKIVDDVRGIAGWRCLWCTAPWRG